MANKLGREQVELYLGNIPNNMKEEDVLEIFGEYPGVALRNLIKNENKCFGFLICESFAQASEITEEFNGTEILGRKLIVRPGKHSQKKEMDSANAHSESSESDQFDRMSKPNSSVRSKYPQSKLSSDAKENNSEDKSYFDYTSHHSESSSEHSEREYSFVSVANFPFRTTVGNIFDLFADYHPLKVWMICNYPDPENVTEAIICFSNPDEAFDAIMTFDNTKYRHRTLLVTDANDSTIIPELLEYMSQY